ncbi:cytochrome P450 [Massilia sp. B-10]|nr:cytochrome P450 [Massilia sp. B-10]
MGTYSFLDPELIREVLVEKADSFIRYRAPHERAARSPRPERADHRGRHLEETAAHAAARFQPETLCLNYALQMEEAATTVLDKLASHQGQPFDFEQAMNMLTMDVIVRTMFSARITAQETQDTEHAVRLLSQIAYDDMFYPASLPDWLPLPSKRAKRRAMRLLDDLIWKHIRLRGASGEVHDDLLGMLLTAADSEGDGSVLSDEQVRDQLMTTFWLSHETTASGLTWARSWVLASHPEMAFRAAEEVDTVLEGRSPTFADVARLPYLGQVVKETLRMYSPAPGVFMRQAAQDVQIGPWLLPKGSLVTLLSSLVQRDPRWFPDPDTFDPDRFAPEAARQVPRGAYFPFGTGPRVCIGNSFASMEMTLILATLLQRYTLRPAPGQEQPGMRLQVTMRPAGGLRLMLASRKRLTPSPGQNRRPRKVVRFTAECEQRGAFGGLLMLSSTKPWHNRCLAYILSLLRTSTPCKNHLSLSCAWRRFRPLLRHPPGRS